MLGRRPFSFAVALAVCGASAAISSLAHADPSKAECASAYEKSQEQRASGKLMGAREQLAICAADACPAFVRTDCGQWLTEVEHEIPTVSFSIKDTKGEDTTAVTVKVDGADLLTELSDKSVQVDPGSHKFEFTMDGASPISREFEIRKGEKDRVLNVSFAPARDDAKVDDPYSHGAASESPPAGDEGASSGPGPLRPYAYVAGGVGAAGVLGFVIFGAMGKSKQSDLDSSCGPSHTCSKDDVDSIKTKYVLADISLGVGIAGLGTGVALFFLSQPKGQKAEDSEETAHFDLVPHRDGAFATYSGRF